MDQSARHLVSVPRLWRICGCGKVGNILMTCLAAAIALAYVGGCTDDTKDKDKERKRVELKERYPTLPAREKVPAFMKDTVWEVCDIRNKDPYLVSGYGMVVGLAGTGNNTGTPLPVRNYMIDEMVRHGFGTANGDLRPMKPERVVTDPQTAIVEVYAYLPPGARAQQRIDLFVQAATGSQTKSLARGMLYQADLFDGGVDPLLPKGRVNVYAKAKGPVFVKPTYVANEAAPATQPGLHAGLRNGMVLGGGLVMMDRHLIFRVRQPQLSVARTVELRIDQRFQDDQTAKTEHEAEVFAFVPKNFNGDWEHFLGVATHLYLNGSQGYLVVKARELAAEAVKPDAPLQDISYCWEGIGEDALPFIQPLYGHKDPEVAFAAARAGACIGDATAEMALLEMARTEGQPFRFNAVKVLGSLRESPRISRMLNELLASSNALVRIEAYRILVEQSSPAVISKEIRGQFVLDRIICDGPPLLYATRSGVPRIAIFGQTLGLKSPIMFSAMDNKLTISTPDEGQGVLVFDRTSRTRIDGVKALMKPDLFEMVYRLGGGSDDGFAFCYSDLVGVLQALSAGRHIAADFVLQDSPNMSESVEDAPPLPEPAAAAAPAAKKADEK